MKMKFSDMLLDAMYPPVCGICEELILANRFFCDECKLKLAPVIGKRCLECGHLADHCECDRFLYHFDGVCAPFGNDGGAHDAFYAYKFSKHRRLSFYFASAMASLVKHEYKEIKFDILTYVPPSDPRTEYDHVGFLANDLAWILRTKVTKTLKLSGKPKKVQHQLSFDKRFDNVHNAYSVAYPVKGKTVLLIDDIKTSGATIDECARQLKFSGAKAVYCVTALMGELKKDR